MRLSILILVLAATGCGHEVAQVKVMPLSDMFAQAEQPYLFTDSAMRTYLTFQQPTDTVVELKITHLTDNGWSSPQLVSKGSGWFVNWADYPVVSSNGVGFLLVHWLVRSGESKFAYDIYVATSNNEGASWNTPLKLHSDTTQTEHGFVSAVPFGNQFLVCWLDGRNTGGGDHAHHGSMTLRAAWVNTKGQKLQEWELDDRVCDCCQTTAARTATGPVVIYRNRSEDEVRDIFITRFENQQWSAPKPVHADGWIIQGCPVNGPRCEALGNILVVAWFTAAREEPKVQVIFSDDGGKSFGMPIRVDEGNPIGRVDVLLRNENEALVSWMEGDLIKVIAVTRNGKKGKAITVAKSAESRAAGFPQLARTIHGAVMAWTSPEEGGIKSALLYWAK